MAAVGDEGVSRADAWMSMDASSFVVPEESRAGRDLCDCLGWAAPSFVHERIELLQQLGFLDPSSTYPSTPLAPVPIFYAPLPALRWWHLGASRMDVNAEEAFKRVAKRMQAFAGDALPHLPEIARLHAQLLVLVNCWKAKYMNRMHDHAFGTLPVQTCVMLIDLGDADKLGVLFLQCQSSGILKPELQLSGWRRIVRVARVLPQGQSIRLQACLDFLLSAEHGRRRFLAKADDEHLRAFSIRSETAWLASLPPTPMVSAPDASSSSSANVVFAGNEAEAETTDQLV